MAALAHTQPLQAANDAGPRLRAIPDRPGAHWARLRLAALRLEFVFELARLHQGEPEWSPAELDRLRSLRAAGKSYSQCAAVLPGRTRNACISKCWREGIEGIEYGDDPFLMEERRPLVASRVAAWSDRSNDAVAIPSAGKTFLELGPRDCRWPFGEGRHMRFCGQHASAGVYCADHGRASCEGGA